MATTLTLSEFVEVVWAPRAERRLASTTWKRDSAVYNKHVLPTLGDRPIAKIDVEDLARWQDTLEAAGVGAPTMIKAIGILSRIFAEAARRPRSTGVQGNPVALLERPAPRRRRRPLVWGPIVVECVRFQLLVNSCRIGSSRRLAALCDAHLVGFMAMTGCRPGEALALRWRDVDNRVAITRSLSGSEIVERTKTGRDRSVPLLAPARDDLAALREHSGGTVEDFVFAKPGGGHWLDTDWRNYRSRHFVPALRRVEAEWTAWRAGLPRPDDVRESVTGLNGTRPYDLGRHTHSALMLASGMSLQRLARIQGHSIRVLDQTYSEQLVEYEESDERIDPVREILRARFLVWTHKAPAHKDLLGTQRKSAHDR